MHLHKSRNVLVKEKERVSRELEQIVLRSQSTARVKEKEKASVRVAQNQGVLLSLHSALERVKERATREAASTVHQFLHLVRRVKERVRVSMDPERIVSHPNLHLSLPLSSFPSSNRFPNLSLYSNQSSNLLPLQPVRMRMTSVTTPAMTSVAPVSFVSTTTANLLVVTMGPSVISVTMTAAMIPSVWIPMVETQI